MMSADQRGPASEASDTAPDAPAHPSRKPWGTPTLDVMPANSARLGGNSVPEGNETS